MKAIEEINVVDADFYPRTLQAILDMQKDILESDRNTQRNKKGDGYSRLFDISVELQTQLIAEWLHTEPETVAKAYSMIEGSLKDSIDVLGERQSKEGHGLLEKLKILWHRLKNLFRAEKLEGEKSLPKQLNYLQKHTQMDSVLSKYQKNHQNLLMLRSSA